MQKIFKPSPGPGLQPDYRIRALAELPKLVAAA
jgi:hypothetical protein